MSETAPGLETSDPSGLDRQGYRRFHVVLLLVLPLVLLAANPNVFINPGGNSSIDPWVYTGFFLSLPSHILRFGGAYYGNRLSWIIPGFLAHLVLPPLAANYALHLTFFYVLLFATYRFLETGLNRSNAMLGTLLVGWNPVIQDAHSWDYVDGAGITYLMLMLLCLERASAGRRRLAWSAAAGMLATCLVVTNLTLVALLPACAVFFLLRTGLSRWRAIALTTLAAAGGAALAFAAFGAFNRAVGGPWLFLAPSIQFARTVYNAPNPWKAIGFHWNWASWLALPVFAGAGAILSLVIPPRGEQSFARAVHLTVLTAVAAWVVSDIAGNSALLEYPYYVSYLAPLALLSLALQGEAAHRSVRAAVILELAAFATLAAVHVIFLKSGSSILAHVSAWVNPAHTTHEFVVNTSIMLTAGFLAVLALRFARPPALRWAVFLPAIAVAFAAPHYQGASPVDGRTEFETTALAHRFITKQIGTRTIRFWYPPPSRDSPPFSSITSTFLWQWDLLNETLPRLTRADAAKLTPDTRMVLLLYRDADADDARAALRQFGLGSAIVAHQEFGVGSRAVSVVIADLAPLKPGS